MFHRLAPFALAACLVAAPSQAALKAGAAAPVAPGKRIDHGLPKRLVHVLDQQPRAPVRHPHFTRSCGNRSSPGYRLEQVCLAGAHRDDGADDACRTRWSMTKSSVSRLRLDK